MEALEPRPQRHQDLAGCRLVRVGGLCGVASPLVSLGLIMVSVAMSPWFNWHRDALSDLGVGRTAIWFNLGLVIGGFFNAMAAVGMRLWIGRGWLAQSGTLLLVLGSAALALVGVLTTDYGALHNSFAKAYFLLSAAGCLLLAAALILKERLLHGILTGSAGAAAIVAAALTPHQGLAVPEILAALILSSWVYSMGMTLLVQPGG